MKKGSQAQFQMYTKLRGQLWTQNQANKMGCGGSNYHHWVLLMRRVEVLVSLHLQAVMTTKQHQETQVSRFLGKHVTDTVKEVNSVQTDLGNRV